MKLRFTKMHGCGNDYVYVNCFEQEVQDPVALSIAISDRHFGVGGDGLVLICPSAVADAKMRMFNADGSEGKMCGNAIRCVGKYLYDSGMVHKPTVTIETLSGIKTLELFVKDGRVDSARVNMGPAILTPADIPVNLPGDRAVAVPADIAGKQWEITCVSMGNPHCVVFGGDPDGLDLPAIGPRFENDPLFPQQGIHPGPGLPHPENAGLGAGQRRDLGLRHRSLRGGDGGGPERLLPEGRGRAGAPPGRRSDGSLYRRCRLYDRQGREGL